MKKLVQKALIAGLRPYVSRELIGWGRLYNLVADYRHDWIWKDAPTLSVTNKFFGYKTDADLSKWPDRQTYFLRRWHDLGSQLFLREFLIPTDTVVDVGANRGEFSLFVAHVVPQGQVISFEPSPIAAATLRYDLTRNMIRNVTVNQIGLSDENKQSELTAPRHNSGEGSLVSQQFADSASFMVSVRPGDALLADIMPTLIKIDVEGYELRVLKGLKNTIHRCHPVIITEIERSHLARCGSSPEQIKELLETLGYSGFAMGLQKKDGLHSWCLEEFDINKSGFDAIWFHATLFNQAGELSLS